METFCASHSVTSMLSSLHPGLSSNPTRNSRSPASHERIEAKKKSRKRKNLLDRYGSSKRRRLASAASREKVPTIRGETFHNSSLAEPLPLSNGALVPGSNSETKVFGKPPKKNTGKANQKKRKDLEPCIDLDINHRISSCSQAAQLDNAEIICSPSSLLPKANTSEPVQQLSCDRMQDTPEGMVLRPRRLLNKEIKENLPPSVDSFQIVGRRIEVYWPLDAAWYCGLISAYDDVRKKHKVSYDDGEEEWLCLSHEKFRFEVFCKIESGGKAQENQDGKNGCAIRDDFIMSTLPLTSPIQGTHIKASSKGSVIPLLSPCKGPTGFVKDTSPQANGNEEATVREEITGLKAQNDTKFFLQRHKGISIGQSKDGGDVYTANRVDVGRVYVRRQKHGLRGRSADADHHNSQDFHQVESRREEQRQDRSNRRRKQKQSNQIAQHNEHAVHLGSQGRQDTENPDGKLEGGSAVYMGQPGLTNPRKRNRRCSNDEASSALVSLEGSVCMPDSTYSGIVGNAGISTLCMSGQPSGRLRRKHRVKSLTDTTLAAKAVKEEVRVVAGLCDRENKQIVFGDLAMMAEPSVISQQKDALFLSCKETEASGASKPAITTSRRKFLADKLEFPAAGVKSKGGKKSAGGHRRGCHWHRKAMKKRQRLQGFARSLPLPSSKAASTHCKSIVGFHTEILLSDTRVMKPACRSSDSSTSVCNFFQFQGAQELARQNSSTSDLGLESSRRLSLQTPLRAFHSSLHLRRPELVCGLFTWQLFNMFKAVGLCNGDYFGARFSWMGSTRDLADIVLLFMTIVKALPFTSQRCHQHWQGRVLHELWSVLLRREQWVRSLPALLSHGTDNLLMQHLRGLISGHCVTTMTSRQMLNILSSYVLKPYVIAILCEEGAQLTAVVQRFQLLTCPLKDGISFKRQFVKWVKLRSHAGAEADFSSYLVVFPMAEQWCTGSHKFETLMKDGIASEAHAANAQQSIPIPLFKFSSNQGLQFTTALVSCKKFTPQSGLSTLPLQRVDGSFGADSLAFTKEARDLLSHGKFACFNQFETYADFYTGLCFNSMLQKYLHLAGSKPVESHCDKGADAVGDGHPMLEHSSLKVDAVKEEDIVESCKWEVETPLTTKDLHKGSPHCIANDYSVLKSGKAITQGEGNNTCDIKVDGFLQSCDQWYDKGAASNTLRGSSTFCLINESVDDASAASSSSSYECAMKWRNTQIAFRPLDMQDQHGLSVYEDSSYLSFGQHSKKRVGSKRRPHGGEHESTDMEQFDPCCIANALITKSDRSWREVGISVELQSKGSEWVISVQIEGGVFSHKVLESTITSRVNRFTHAMMWKGGDMWTLEFCDRTQWACFKGMHEECCHRNARAAFVKQIPIPSVKQIEEIIEGRPSVCWFTGGKWPGEIEDALSCTRRVYDMDSEDESWLAEVNKEANCTEETISIEAFERIVDKLERVTYLKQGEMVVTDEVAELCENLASENAVLTVHAYWFKKRLSKDNALIRYFEWPLWKKYRKQSENWRTKMNEFQIMLPNATKEELFKRCPEPPSFAFCLRSRGLDASNSSKRVQRQRSQKHLNPSFKYTRTSSFETSEESQRVSLLRSQRMRDSLSKQDWYQTSQKGDYWQRKMLRDGFFPQLVSNLCPPTAKSDGYTLVGVAQANAGAARQLAQMYFLRFDSALQRAVAAVMEFETIYIAELNLKCESPTTYEQLLIFRKRIDRVLNQFFSLAGKEDFRNRDGDLGAFSDDADADADAEDDDDDDDPSFTVCMQADGFGGSPISDDLLREEGTFLSISERAHLESWMRSTLRQRSY